MMGGAALGSRAIGDITRRTLASEWGGPEPAAKQTAIPAEADPPRRVTLQKP